MRESPREAWRIKIFRLAAFSIVYFLAVLGGESLYGTVGVPSPFWFPDAVLLCALLLTPRHQWWVWLLAIWPIRLALGAPDGTPLWFVLFGIANDTAKALLAAWWLHRLHPRRIHLDTLSEFARFLAIAAFAVPLASALVAAPARYVLGDSLWSAGYRWFLGDAVAQVIVTPTLLYWCAGGYRRVNARMKEIALMAAGLLAVLYFAFVLGIILLCRRSASARQNLPGYVFAAATLGLAGVLYLGYASFVVLKAVCLLCVGSYLAIIALFLISGRAARYPMSSLPGRAARDLRLLLQTPAALTAAVAFIAAAAGAVVLFPTEPISAATSTAPSAPAATPAAAQATAQAPPPGQTPLQQLETYLSQQPRVPIIVPSNGAAVVIVKFNDYQCPPCGQTFREYKPILAKLQQKYPGKITFMTRDFPLDPECNSLGGPHPSGCEAAVAVRLAREKGKAEAMEEWLFANQPSMTPEFVKQGAASVGGVTDFDARYAKTIELVKGDIAQGMTLQVRGTPSFFMNGIRLPNLRGEFFEAAVEWELHRLSTGAR